MTVHCYPDFHLEHHPQALQIPSVQTCSRFYEEVKTNETSGNLTRLTSAFAVFCEAHHHLHCHRRSCSHRHCNSFHSHHRSRAELHQSAMMFEAIFVGPCKFEVGVAFSRYRKERGTTSGGFNSEVGREMILWGATQIPRSCPSFPPFIMLILGTLIGLGSSICGGKEDAWTMCNWITMVV